MLSHLESASLSSTLLRFSISLLSLRLKSTFFSLLIMLLSPAIPVIEGLRLLISPRGLTQMSQTTLAEEFSNVQAGHCHTLLAVDSIEVLKLLLCRFEIMPVFDKFTAPVLCRCKGKETIKRFLCCFYLFKVLLWEWLQMHFFHTLEKDCDKLYELAVSKYLHWLHSMMSFVNCGLLFAWLLLLY